MHTELQQNEVYEIAKKITAINNEEQQDEMLDELSEVIARHFESKDSTPIEDAIALALKESDIDTTNVIMDEAYLEIESLCYEDGPDEFESTMQLIPCTVMTDNESAIIPSINDFENVIRKHLIHSKIIDSEDQFRLGTVFLNEDDVGTFNFQNWWNMHRAIIEEDEETKLKNSVIRNQAIKIIPDSTVSLFYLVPIIVNQDNNTELVNIIYNSYTDVETWGAISANLSSEEAKVTVFPPMGISETITQSSYILQDIEFDEFFDEYAADESIDIGYMQLSDDPNEYVVLFFDNEDYTVRQCYNYGTQGEVAEFASLLVTKCIKNNNKTLFSFDETIDMGTLDKWRNADSPVSIKKLLQKSNAIDLQESYRMSMINNPNSDPIMDGYSKQRTIH